MNKMALSALLIFSLFTLIKTEAANPQVSAAKKSDLVKTTMSTTPSVTSPTITEKKTTSASVQKQPETTSYWSQLKSKISQQLQPFYKLYEQNQATINPIAKSIIYAGMTKILHDYIQKMVTSHYRIETEKKGQGYLQEPGTPGTAVSGLPYTFMDDLRTIVIESREGMNKRFNINMSEDLYQRWLDYTRNMGKK